MIWKLNWAVPGKVWIKCLKLLLVQFSLFLSQLKGRSKRRPIKLKEVMDIDPGKIDQNDDGMLHKCNQCEYTSSRAGHLRAHLKTHSGETLNRCNQCDFACTDPSSLRRHLKAHSGEKSNKCNQCEYTSSQKGHLRAHLKIHSGEKSNKCNQCDYACSDPTSMRKHMKRHRSASLGDP